MVLVDLIIIALLVWGFYEGWKKGLLTSVVKLVSAILIFALAIILKKPISLILIEHLPFFSFGGLFKDITSLNILLYEGIAFFICIAVLSIVFNILLKITGVLNKFINATIILGLPNKLGGAIVNTLRFFVIAFIVIFIASLIPQTSGIIKETTLADKILNNTPVLTHATKNLNNTITEIYGLAKSIDKNKKDDEINQEALEIMLKYGIVSRETLSDLVKSGKINEEDFSELNQEYEKSRGE